MINFFRRIRQKLLSENKLSKYFIYAIGEIILVMIGILLALQVNNWNKDRQDHRMEVAILDELSLGLTEDKTLLLETLKAYEKDYALLNQLDSLLKNVEHPYNKNMNTLFGKVYGIRFARLNNAFYEDLKSSGLQIIANKKIRSDIVNLFEINYKLLNSFLENERSVNQVIRPFYLANFSDIDFQVSARPIDYQEIWLDPYFKNIVHYRIITLKFNQLDEYKKTISNIDAIQFAIEEYLRKSESKNLQLI